MIVFLDANILFSGSFPGSPIARLLQKLANHATLVTCGYAVNEARRNIEVKFPARLVELTALLAGVTIVETNSGAGLSQVPDKDRPILGSAIHAGCTHLVTGDRRDFGALYGASVHGTVIVSPPQLAALLSQKSAE